MTETTLTDTAWEAPGPGAWERDAAHQERPFSTLWIEQVRGPMQAAMSAAFARFGLPLEGAEVANVRGWMFVSLVPVAEDAFPSRMAAAARALEERPWRAIADEWYAQTRAPTPGSGKATKLAP